MKIRVLNSRDRRIIAGAAKLARDIRRTWPTRRMRAAVNVVMVNDRRIHELNLRYRRRDRPTDVLSFPLNARDPESDETLIGEVYVSRDRARIQAREYRASYHKEVQRLILHGILHLLGLPHEEMDGWYEKYL